MKRGAAWTDLDRIKMHLEGCRSAAAIEAGTGSFDDDWEPTKQDLEWVTDQLGWKPRREQWRAAGVGWVGSAHVGEGSER